MTEPDPEQLWRSAQAGDGQAFGRLFDLYAPEIRTYCFHRTGSHSAADDLTSIVFLEAWRRHRTIRPGAVRPWLYGVAVNVLRNRNRALIRYRNALARVPQVESEADFADDVNMRLDAELRMRRILAEVARLPRLEQEVLSLCLWHDMTSREAAAVLEIPETTVRTRLYRARTRLSTAASQRLATETQDQKGEVL